MDGLKCVAYGWTAMRHMTVRRYHTKDERPTLDRTRRGCIRRRRDVPPRDLPTWPGQWSGALYTTELRLTETVAYKRRKPLPASKLVGANEYEEATQLDPL